MAVKTPKGISCFESERATLSTINKNAPPAKIDAGKRNFEFEPINILIKWGITSPTQPINPPTEMAAAVRIVEHIITTQRRRLVSIPRDLASLSPNASTLILQLNNNNRVPLITTGRIIGRMFSMEI